MAKKAGAAKLDRSRPFGTVYGTGADHRYEQDGKNFKGDGSECSAPQVREAQPDDTPATTNETAPPAATPKPVKRGRGRPKGSGKKPPAPVSREEMADRPHQASDQPWETDILDSD